MLKKINISNWVITGIIISVAATRLINLGHFNSWSNISPIGAMALFGGAHFSNKLKAFSIPLITLFISDVIIYYGYFHIIVWFYDGVFWVYLSFAIMVLIGTYMRTVNVKNVVLASLAAVFLHWLISDIVPWWYGPVYPKTFAGYIECLMMAIPYERNLLVGNLVYSALMFGGFELAKRKFEILRTVKTTS